LIESGRSEDLWNELQKQMEEKGYAVIEGSITIRPNVPYIQVPLHTNSGIGGMDGTNGRDRSGLQGSLGEKRSA
jgi:hypothetical protein